MVAGDTDVRDTRRKLDRFIGLTDGVRRGWAVTPAGTAAGASLQMIAPVQALPPDAPLILYLHGGGYIVGG